MMARRINAGSSQRRMTVTENSCSYTNGNSARRKSIVSFQNIQSPTEGTNSYRRGSLADTNRTSVVSRTSSASSNRSAEMEAISETDMARLLTLYNSKRLEVNNVGEEMDHYSDKKATANLVIVLVLFSIILTFVFFSLTNIL